MGVVTGASSGSGVAPALWSESLPHFKHDDGSFDGGDFLVDSNEEKGPSPPMIEWRPALEQHGGGIVGMAQARAQDVNKVCLNWPGMDNPLISPT